MGGVTWQMRRLAVLSSHLRHRFRPLTAAYCTAGETIFDKIIRKEIPSKIVHEDDKCLAFRDVAPQAPTHILLIPKDRDGLTQLSKSTPRHKEILGHLMVTAAEVARKEGMADGWRLVVNDGVHGCLSLPLAHPCDRRLPTQLASGDTR